MGKSSCLVLLGGFVNAKNEKEGRYKEPNVSGLFIEGSKKGEKYIKHFYY